MFEPDYSVPAIDASPLSPRQHDEIVAIIDRVKLDEKPLDTDEYVAMVDAAVRPRFRASTVFDMFRMQWNRITGDHLLEDADNARVQYVVALGSHRGRTVWMNVTPAQAEHIVAYLSETTETH